MTAPLTETIEQPVPGPMTPRERITQVIQAARATLSEDGTTARVEVPGDTPGQGDTGDENDFPLVEDVPGEVPPEPAPEPVALTPEQEADERTVIVERQPGQNVKMTFRTKEEADVIRGLQRGSIRREELHRERQEVAAQREELQQFQDLLEIDRAGVITEMIPPEARRELLTQLLLADDVLDDPEFTAALDRWREDGAQRRADRLEVENARFKARQDLEGKYEQRRALRQTANTALDVTEALGKQFLPDRQLRESFMDDMVADIKAWANGYQAEHGRVPALTPAHILQITARRLAVYRIPVDAAARALDPNTATPPRARPKGPEAERIAEAARKARETGARFTAAANGRKVAALIPGSGVAGAPGDQSSMTPPKGQSWKERSTWLRERLGLKH